MQDLTDTQLLSEFVENGSQEAFSTLVARYLNLVYSAGLRKTGNPDAAQEIAQVVFTILAQKAHKLSPKTSLPGWLYEATRLTASSYIRSESRRLRREQEAYMRSLHTESESDMWEQLKPLLEDAMGTLGEKERNAVLLRYFEGKSFQEIGHSCAVTENGAKKRVGYALEKLRRYFSKRGVALTSSVLAGIIAANSVQAAPVGLAATVSIAAITKGATAGGSTLTLIKGALKIMAWSKAKLAALTGVGLLLAAGTTTLFIKQPHQAQPATHPIPREIKAFAAVKEQQARELANSLKLETSPATWSFFTAIQKDDWKAAYAAFNQIKSGNAVWQPVIETEMAGDLFVHSEPTYISQIAQDIIDSIPPGSIYFGGTDAGRSLITALSKSHIHGDPFFTLTQNALVDESYLVYLRNMYGEKIKIPSSEERKQAIENYLQDTKQRLKKNQLMPGEQVSEENGKLNFRGGVSTMQVNALLAKSVFEANPNCEFFIEESFPLEWMYPYLSPNGFVMKLKHNELAQITPEMVAQDQDYWDARAQKAIGFWLKPETSLEDVCQFVENTYVKQNTSGFRGDPRFLKDSNSRQIYAKLRSSIAGLYVWRSMHTKDAGERKRMQQAADYAFRQAYSFCPSHPETLFRYLNLLMQEKKAKDAVQLLKTAMKVDPKNDQLRLLLTQISGQA